MRNGAMLLVSTPSAHARHRVAALICAAAVLAIVFAFGETALSMVQIWRSSETFSHGFVVVPIALWLGWRKREELARIPMRPYWPGLLMVAAAGFLWLLGSLADANVVQHFALVLLIQSAVVVIVGLAMSRALAFPLLFLFFAVPFGEAFVPKMMDWTADFTVLALKVSGVPVYREGNSFIIPSGSWSVVEACSGVRYLISSLMAGTLYAYLMYKSVRRRLLFVGAAILVPIVANWLRAYVIVMIGHLSANQLATGVDHLIYGWVFFGIILFALFWIGARYREDDAAPAADAMQAGFAYQGSGRIVWAALSAVVLAVAWSPLSAAILAVDAERPRVLPQLSGAQGWEAVESGPVATWRPHFAGQRAEMHQTFERGSDRVVVAVYYYAGQSQGRELINSDNVLVTTKDSRWHVVGRGQAELGATESPTSVRTASLAGTLGRFDVAWWYWVDSRTTISDSVAKVLLAWSRLRLRSDDSAAVFVFTLPSSRNGGAELLQRFTSDMGKAIEHALSTAREGGP